MIAAQGRTVWYAFLCEADTAVTPTDVTNHAYFTNDQADKRCKHNCTSEIGKCPRNDASVTMPPLTKKEALERMHTSEKDQLHSSCSAGYDGVFCQSCAPNFYSTGGKGNCEPCVDSASFCVRSGWNMCYISMLAMVLAVPTLYALVRMCSRWYARICHKVEKPPVDDDEAGADQPRASAPPLDFRQTQPYLPLSQTKARKFCGWTREDLTLLRVAAFPAVKILVTYAQVTGQLSHVLHVQYPQKFTNGVNRFRFLLDFWSIFFTADCNEIMGYELGSYKAHWWMRVFGQPLVCLLFVEVICFISWWGQYSSKAEAKKDRTQNRLRAGFLCYPTICNLCFSTLNCIDDTATSQVLVDDDRVRCPEPGRSHWLWGDGIEFIRFLSFCILGVVGVGAPLTYFWRVRRASKNGAEELRLLFPVRDMARQELPDDPDIRRTDDGRISMRASRGLNHRYAPGHVDDAEAQQARLRDRQEKDKERVALRIEELWQRTWRYWLLSKCCCCSGDVPGEYRQKHRDRLERKLQLKWRSEQISDDVEAAFVESMKLQTFSSLTEAYRPGSDYCYWEAVDMLRKFFLVGVVVTVGRGSVLQNVISTFLSFLFFALHVKMWPMKTNEDNILKASCEIHVFWTITTAFVMRSDLTHEKLGKDDFYDPALLISFVICVPLAFISTVWWKLRRASTVMLDDIVQIPRDKRRSSAAARASGRASGAAGSTAGGGGGGGSDSLIPQIPQKEFRKYTLGLASMDDRRALKDYFQAMLR
jgi:hypothetical protein